MSKRRVITAAWSWWVATAVNADGDATSLDRMHDIVMPPPLPWWPPAPGWYVLLALVVMSIAYTGWRHYRRTKTRRYRVEALAALHAIPLADTDQAVYAAQVMALLRRAALAVWPRTEIVGLRGAAWWQFLDAKVARPAFAAELGPLCERLAYAPGHAAEPADNLERVRDAAAYWIKAHRAPARRRRAMTV